MTAGGASIRGVTSPRESTILLFIPPPPHVAPILPFAARSTSPPSPKRTRLRLSVMIASNRQRFMRRGSIESTVAIGLGSMIALGFAIQMVLGGISGTIAGFFEEEPEFDFLTTQVVRAPFVHTVLERGEIESSSNIEVRCQVRGRTSAGVNILEIVPEGTFVNPGDFLVRLDDSLLQTQLIQQQIVSSNSEASVIESEAALESAKLALNEYDQGTFNELLAKQQSDVFVAEENMRRADEYVEYSRRLAERGYIPEAQVEADAFALEKSKKDLGVAQTKLEVLNKFTREKMMTQLRAAIQTADAKLRSRRKTWELDQVQLSNIIEQIKLCTISAPGAGQVVYENNRGRSSSTILIEEGMPVRERQTIINLPDPTKMRVMTKVHESRIGNVKKGQPAELKLDAMPELPLAGTVTDVSEYPLPPINVYMAHVKEYTVAIEIDDPPADLRPGMTAEVNVLIEEIDDALQVPIEAVLQRCGEFYCAVSHEDGTIETRELTIGSANETNLVVLSGLTVDDEIVLNVSDEEVLECLTLPEDDS